jgi:hypothetical protein
MDHDESSPNSEHSSDAAADDGEAGGAALVPPDDSSHVLARVRYGLGKELRLYRDELDVIYQETGEELHLRLDSLVRLILAPGEQVPSKLVLMFDLNDGNTIIAAEGMSNVRDFRALLARLRELKPELELDPPNMDEQLAQALDIRRRSNLGCYGVIVAACVLLWVVYMVVAFIGAHGPH